MTVTASLDKTTYAKGDPMTLTVGGFTNSAADQPITVHVDAGPDGSTDLTGTLHSPPVVEPVTVTDADRTWTVKSNDGTTAVYTATA